MAHIGRKSVVRIGETNVAEINEASFSINGELLDATVFGSDQFRKKLANFVDANISISGFYDGGDATGQAIMRNSVLTGAEVENISVLADRDVADSGFTANALVGNFEISSSVSGLVTVSISLETNGPITVSS